MKSKKTLYPLVGKRHVYLKIAWPIKLTALNITEPVIYFYLYKITVVTAYCN